MPLRKKSVGSTASPVITIRARNGRSDQSRAGSPGGGGPAREGAGVRTSRASSSAHTAKLTASTATAIRYAPGPARLSRPAAASPPRPKHAERTIAATANGRSFGPSPATSEISANREL